MAKLRVYLFIACLVTFLAHCHNPASVEIKISPDHITSIDDELFGQFLEKPSWHGETGIEAAWLPDSGKLQCGVFQLMDEMQIPLLRFPGGTDVDYVDWATMVDGRLEEVRPPYYVGYMGDTVTTHFGYDEAGTLAEQLGAELLLVLNFGDAYFERTTRDEAVDHEMELLAYCAAPLENQLPTHLKKWPELRAKNGHPDPYPVKYVQFANEPWVLDGEAFTFHGVIDGSKKTRYLQCLRAFVDATENYFPDLRIIVDGNLGDLTAPLWETFGDRIDLIAHHSYRPWGVREVILGEDTFSIDSLSDEEIWYGWIAVPFVDDDGLTIFQSQHFQTAFDTPYPLAITEWNSNGWIGSKIRKRHALVEKSRGMGAAGYLHALLRGADRFKLATQSMLVGEAWGITAIRVDREEQIKPHFKSSGIVSAFYSRYHGNQLFRVTHIKSPSYVQPYRFGNISPSAKVRYLDVVATQNSDRTFIHILNRNYTQKMHVALNLEELNLNEIQGWVRTLRLDRISNCQSLDECVTKRVLGSSAGIVKLELPKQSVTILEIHSEISV